MWNNRDIRVKNITVKTADDRKHTFNLDKPTAKKVIYEKKPDTCEAELDFGSEGTKKLLITQRKTVELSKRMTQAFKRFNQSLMQAPFGRSAMAAIGKSSALQQDEKFQKMMTDAEQDMQEQAPPGEDKEIAGMDIDISLKGIGISFIDNQPQELVFLTIDDIFLQYNTHQIKELSPSESFVGNSADKEEDDMTEARDSIILKIGNMQIDN